MQVSGLEQRATEAEAREAEANDRAEEAQRQLAEASARAEEAQRQLAEASARAEEAEQAATEASERGEAAERQRAEATSLAEARQAEAVAEVQQRLKVCFSAFTNNFANSSMRDIQILRSWLSRVAMVVEFGIYKMG